MTEGYEVFHNDGTVTVTRVSAFTGKIHEMKIVARREQFAKWKAGQMIQYAFPQLNADEREFIMTGITAEEWDKYIPKE